MLRPTQGDPVNKIRAVNRVSKGMGQLLSHVQSARVRQKLDHWTVSSRRQWSTGNTAATFGQRWSCINRYILHNAKGRKVLGYGTVHLARDGRCSFRPFYRPQGRYPEPVSATEPDTLTITSDDP